MLARPLSLGRVYVCIFVWVNTLLPEAEPWVDQSVGGQAPWWVPLREGGKAGKRARSRAARSAGSSVCVSQALWLSTGAAWHPQECGFSRIPRLPLVPQGGGRQEKEGEKGRSPPSPTRASNKGQFI